MNSPDAPNVPSSAFLACIDAFLEHLQIERDASPHTLSAYRHDLQKCASWAVHQGHSQFEALTSQCIRAFIQAEHTQGISHRSLGRRVYALRSFYAWLSRKNPSINNPMSSVRAPKVHQRKLPAVLDVDEAVHLVTIPTDDPLGMRDRALLELLYSSALRVSEICQLTWSSLDLDSGLVRVHGKGRRDRIVPVGAHAINALRAWKAQTPSQAHVYVFPGRNGKHLTARAIQLRVKYWGIQQNLFKSVHPHMLRHSCASHILQSSKDLRGVQELLGHADIATTQIYTHLDFQALAQVYDTAHPRAQRRKRVSEGF